MATEISIGQILASPNVAELLSSGELQVIGHRACEDYRRDRSSRSEWEQRSANAMKLALQVVEAKTFPFDGASNVKFPVVTIATLQFHARAYPALISGTDLVRMRVIGEDQDGEKAERASRISQHMSWQVLEEDEDWEEQMDRLLIALPIEGCEFKKSWFDPLRGHNVSQWVRPEDLVVPYYTTSLDDATRITHVLSVPKRVCDERKRAGLYLDVDLHGSSQTSTPGQDARDERQGITRDMWESDYTFYEQHTFLDLDGDGYLEPYVVMVHEAGHVLRIMPRFGIEDILTDGEKIIRITAFQHFTKYAFIPSPDGGFYDLGFGHLLGPLNESINTTLNQIIDSGTQYNLQAGFLGRVKLKGGNMLFRQGEWKQVDAVGDDIRKHIMPLPVREPSSVLFSVLSFLVDYSNRLGSVTDIMVGNNPGQNQPATTTMAVLEQGMMVFNGIFKRIHRSMKQEFRRLYDLNRRYLDPQSYFEVLDTGQQQEIYQLDYLKADPKDLRPTADPNMASAAQLLAKAEALRQAAYTGVGYNTMAVEHRYLEALKIPNIEEVHPMQNPIPPTPDPKIEIDKAKLEQRASEQQMKYTFQMQRLAISAEKEQATILKLQADAALALARAEKEGSVADLETFKAGMDAAERRRQAALETYRLLQEISGGGAGVSGMEASPGNGAAIPVPQGQANGHFGGMGLG